MPNGSFSTLCAKDEDETTDSTHKGDGKFSRDMAEEYDQYLERHGEHAVAEGFMKRTVFH